MRGNMMRVAGTLAAIAMVVGGCNCPGPAVDCTDTTITFETPTGGMMVDAPFDVSVNVKAADGSAFNIDAATLNVGGMSFTGTVSGNRATFSGVTAPAGEQTLSVAIARDTCSKTATSTVTVRDTCSAPAVTAVSFPQDTGAPLGVLNRTEIPPGTNLQVKVDATCVSGVQVRIKRGTMTVGGPADFVNGTVTLTLATLPDSDDARYDLFAELVRNGTAINTPTSNPQAAGTIQVNRVAPMVTLTTQASYGPSDDVDPMTPGIQIRVTGTAPDNTACTLTVSGLPPQQVTPAMGSVSGDFTLPSGSHTATLTCTDAAGNTGTATATFIVDIDPPVVTITSPANVDGGATMVTQSPLPVIVSTDAEDGSVAVIYRDGVQVDSATVANGMVTLQVAFGLDGTYSLEVRVTDGAGNVGSATVVVTVQLSGCGAQFSRPAACPTLLTAAQAPGGSYSFQTTSNAICAGQPAALFRSDSLADGGTTAPVGIGMATLNGQGFANFPPVVLVSGSYVFRADVTGPGDAGVSTVHCDVLVDLEGPQITNPVVPMGQMSAVINAAQDTQPMTPGVQRSFTFSARVPQGGRVDVCTTQAVDPASMQQRLTSPECGSGWYVLAQGVASPVSGFTFPNGVYDIKVVVVGSGLAVAPASPAVSLTVDGDRPCLSAISRRLPQDANMDGALNIAELGGGNPRLEFALGCGETPATLAMGGVTIRNVVAGAPGAVRPATVAFAGGVYTVTLTGTFSADVDLDLWVELTDLAGNQNLFTASDFALHVDPIAPTCDIQSPGPSQSLIGQAGAPGGMFQVVVATALDIDPNGVRVTFGATAPRDLTPVNGSAQTSYSVSGTNAYAVGATCTDHSGNSTTAVARNITIDLDAPVCAITAPTSMTYGTNQIITTVTATGAEGRPVTVRSSASATPLTVSVPMTISSATSSATLTYPNGNQTVTAEVSDLAGNLCSAMVAGVNVATAGCSLTLTNVFVNSAGAWFNRSNTGSLTATSGVIASVNGLSDCTMGQTVTLQRTAPTMGTALMSTVNGSGAVSFANVAVNDGETWTMTIINGAFTTPQSFRVGLRIPTATSVTINGNTLTTGQDLFFVAASGNINLEPAAGPVKATTYFSDVSVAADSQSSIVVAGAAGANYGIDVGVIEVRLGGTLVFSTPVGTEPYTTAATQITLAHNSVGSFVVRVVSAAGNAFDVISNNATVDVKPPSPVTFVSPPAVTASRAATVSATWSPSFDDFDQTMGALVGGPAMQPAGYDVRWTTDLVTNTTGIPDPATFFNSTLVNADSIVAWQAGNIARAITVPPINNYFVLVRARDEVGNYSDFPMTAPARITNRGTEDVILNPTAVAAQRFGGVIAGPDLRTGAGAGFGFGPGIGSVNSDTVDDLVVASPNRAVVHDGGFLMPDAGVLANGSSQTNVGAVYVYFGRAGFGASSTCVAPNCQTIVPYQAQPSSFFGFDVAMGNVDTAFNDASGRLDLLVTSPNYDGNRGRVFLYFGDASSASIDTSSFVEFRGQDFNSRLGGIAKVVPDLNGDGINEVLIASRTEPLTGPNIGQGQLYLYFGRTRAQWLALMASTDAVTGRPFVTANATTASRVIGGPLPVDNNGSASNLWGSTRGIFTPLGDLTGDGVQDFAISANKNNLNRTYLYSGATVNSTSAGLPGVPTPTLLVDELDKGTSGVATGFGTRTIGALNVIGSSLPDLIATQARAAGGAPVAPAACNVKIFPDGTATGFGSAAVTINGSTTRGFGAWAEAADVNNDGRVDLMVGESGATSTSAWVFFQRTGQTFDSAASGGFWQANFSGPANSRRGSAAAFGDFDGDGQVDLVVGDELDVPGRVIVWH